MDIRTFRMALIIWMLSLIKCFGHAEQDNDTLLEWSSKFYKLSLSKVSDDGEWVLASKLYETSSDTLMVFSTRKKEIRPRYAVGKNPLSFVRKNLLFLFGKQQAELWNLATNKRTQYEDIRQAGVLTAAQRYMMVDNSGELTVYSAEGKIILRIADVQRFVTDGERMLYAIRQTGQLTEIVDLSANNATVIYNTKNNIKMLKISPSTNFLTIIETNSEKERQYIRLINTLDKKVNYPEIPDLVPGDQVDIREMEHGNVFMFSSTVQVKTAGSELVEIWYGNDPNLGALQVGQVCYQYWLWNSTSEHLEKIDNSALSIFAPLNSDRYFLSFNRPKTHNYLKRLPALEVHRHDRFSGTNSSLGKFEVVPDLTAGVFTSKDGNYLIGCEDGKKFTLIHIPTMEKRIIGQDSLKNPVFTSDNKYIYFESSDDVWRYDIQLRKLSAMKIAKGRESKIVNSKLEVIGGEFNIFVSNLDADRPVLIKATDKRKNTTSYLLWYRNKSREIVPETADRIESIKYNDILSAFCTSEENYNLPPKLFYADLRTSKRRMLFESNTRDAHQTSLRQEIIHYSNAEGIPLKGVLYYPLNFDPSKKYPMIVYIYEVESDKANKYLAPNYLSNGIGFDIRFMMEQGYFVYRPDIVFTSLGTGLSALDCVNRALDALNDNPSIDKAKIGLTGHSHGGYETNFIATHSDRFAAYVSGAGNSDIVRSYFSYNYNFLSPFYWQFENEQYEMFTPFAENKELYFRNTPIHNVEKVSSPILLWAGKKDQNIAWDQVMEFYIGLRRNNKDVIALFYPKKGHDLGSGPEAKDLFKRMIQWWDYFLKDRKDIQWINKQIKKDA